MKKKIIRKSFISIAILVALLMVSILPLNSPCAFDRAFAAGAPRYVDEVGLVTGTQAEVLEDKLNEVSRRHDFDVVVVVVRSLGGKDERVFAADYYEEHGYGLGDDKAGILLLIATQYRDFAFVTPEGYGTYAFTDAGQEYLEAIFLPKLSKDDYYGAFIAFADAADDFLERAAEGRPYDTGNIPRMTETQRRTARVWAVVYSLAAGLAVALVVTGFWTAQLRSVRKQIFAQSYIRPESMVLRVQNDIFLYRNVQMTRRETQSSSGSGSGSSGSFSSSSGGGFSGRSGKY